MDTTTRDDAVAMCRTCRGCGKVANTEDQEPWTFWAELPAESAIAVLVGLVKPIPCPACSGTGKRQEV